MSQLEQATLEDAPSVAPTDPQSPPGIVSTMPEPPVALTKSTSAVLAALPRSQAAAAATGVAGGTCLGPGIVIAIDDVSDDDYARLI